MQNNNNPFLPSHHKRWWTRKQSQVISLATWSTPESMVRVSYFVYHINRDLPYRRNARRFPNTPGLYSVGRHRLEWIIQWTTIPAYSMVYRRNRVRATCARREGWSQQQSEIGEKRQPVPPNVTWHTVSRMAHKPRVQPPTQPCGISKWRNRAVRPNMPKHSQTRVDTWRNLSMSVRKLQIKRMQEKEQYLTNFW